MLAESERIERLERAVKALIEDSYEKNLLLRNLALDDPVRPITFQWLNPEIAQEFGVALPSCVRPSLSPQIGTHAICEQPHKSHACSAPRETE